MVTLLFLQACLLFVNSVIARDSRFSFAFVSYLLVSYISIVILICVNVVAITSSRSNILFKRSLVSPRCFWRFFAHNHKDSHCLRFAFSTSLRVDAAWIANAVWLLCFPDSHVALQRRTMLDHRGLSNHPSASRDSNTVSSPASLLPHQASAKPGPNLPKVGGCDRLHPQSWRGTFQPARS